MNVQGCGGADHPAISWTDSWDELTVRVAAMEDDEVRELFTRFINHLRAGHDGLSEFRYLGEVHLENDTPNGVLEFFVYLEIIDLLHDVTKGAFRCIPAPDLRAYPPGDIGDPQSDSELIARHLTLAEMATLHPDVSEELRVAVRKSAAFLRPWLARLWLLLAEVQRYLSTLPEHPRPPHLQLRGARWRPVLLQMMVEDFPPGDREEVRAEVARQFEAVYARAGKAVPLWLRDWTVGE